MDSQTEPLEQQLERAKREAELARRDASKFEADARSASEELQQFVYSASHDLQEPLRSVRTYAQLLQREFQRTPEAGELISVIIESANSMDRLVKDLLVYSRTGVSPQLTLVKLNAPFQWAVFKLADLIRDTQAQVTAADLPEVYADEKQIASVFEQLIGNALKYRGPLPPRVEVSAEEGEDFTTLLLRDNGEGVEPEYHQQIFTPFKRLHGKKVPGSGLGLSICRKIVRAHGGSIWIESDGKNGSTLKFTLPL